MGQTHPHLVTTTVDISRENSEITGEIGKKYLKDYAEETDPLVIKLFADKTEKARKIGTIPAHVISAFRDTVRHGKKIRGALMRLGYEMSGGTDNAAILDASLCLELFHAGVLVHDDIMDRDDMRRGLPSMHRQYERYGKELGIRMDAEHYGISQAINLADAAYYLSWEILMDLPIDAERKIQAGKIYADYVLRVVDGQILDVTVLTQRELITQEYILNILKYKTAEYTGVMPLLMGAALAGVSEKTDPERIEAIKKYGLAFGWAFQIQDDILGIYSEEEEIGKIVGSDLKEGKNTLLTLYVMEHGTNEHKIAQQRILGNQEITREDVETMRRVFKESGAYDYVMNLGWKYVEEGRKEITTITSNKKAQQVLESMIVYMMERAL